jgi:hypothetical protein
MYGGAGKELYEELAQKGEDASEKGADDDCLYDTLGD